MDLIKINILYDAYAKHLLEMTSKSPRLLDKTTLISLIFELIMRKPKNILLCLKA